MSPRVFVVAEAGVNHNGSVEMGRQLIDAAAAAAADAVKFQTFRGERLVSRSAPKAEYQLRATEAGETQLEMLKKLELSTEDHAELIEHAERRGIAFLSTPFDSDSLYLLTSRFSLSTIKLGSGELTNLPFLLETARNAESIILSTGMGTMSDVETALGVLAFGFTAPDDEVPLGDAPLRALASDAGRAAIRQRVTLLHCTTDYPANFSEVNLAAMETLLQAFGVPVGYSDHTPGFHITLAAVALGARLIEKHLTLDRKLDGPDHAASLEPDEFSALVEQIRDVERAIGDGMKTPGTAEWKNRAIARRSLVAARPIEQGEAFTVDNLTCKRPGTGVPPAEYWTYLVRTADRAYGEDELI